MNEPLHKPIAVRLLDDAGNPVGGATVHWSASDGGVVAPEETTTDSNGNAHSVWTLGPVAGVQHVAAATEGYAAATFTAVASAKKDADDGPIVVLHLTTPEGSGQSVHPDFAATPTAWVGASRHLTVTPYPYGDTKYENPSIFAGSAPDAWAPRAGVKNPIALPKTGGYLSDPDIVYLPARNALRVYYRAVNAGDIIRMIESADGVHFSAPVDVLTGAENTIVSPAVVRRSATDWLMWSVNSNIGCAAPTTTVEVRRSTDGINWGAPTTVDLAQPGYSVWHIDVQWIPSQNAYWAVFNVKTAGSCTTPALYFASSTDGMTWATYPSPVLARGAIHEFSDIVYRSTFAYDSTAGVMDFWYSGAHYNGQAYVWHSAYQRRFRANVFSAISQVPSTNLAHRALRPGVPPLLVAP
ncbi:MAG TPA: Ig-like domain-containing protein [Gemmatimonadaceae bacterium]